MQRVLKHCEKTVFNYGGVTILSSNPPFQGGSAFLKMGSRGINDFVCKGELKIKGVRSELKRDVSRFF